MIWIIMGIVSLVFVVALCMTAGISDDRADKTYKSEEIGDNNGDN